MKLIQKVIGVLALCLLFNSAIQATDGMWLPNLLKKLNEAEMKSLGMRISAEDIYSVNQGSIKDAVVHFGGGCTAEVVSDKGLIFTNHHCGYGQIQSHSTPEKNYLEKGFWAKNYAEELPNQGLTATFIVRIEDISAKVLEGVDNKLPSKERQSLIDKNIEKVRAETQKETYENIVIRPFYEGNEYYMFITVTYRDVRLVGTPPDFIGKYGADTDNWIWPRHTGDFAIFRIYADKDNKPADYSVDNVPFTPKHSLPISVTPLKENDFLMVFGFPGRTDQYLPAAAIEQVQDILNPLRVEIRDRSLAIIDEAMRVDTKTKIQYASKQSRISNAWKKWRGESLGLKKSDAINERKKYEAEFNKRVAANPAWSDYKGLVDKFNLLYQSINPLARAREIQMEVIQRNAEVTRMAATMAALSTVFEKDGADAFNTRMSRLKAALPGYFKDYQPAIDEQVFAVTMDYFEKNMDPNYIPESMKQLSAKHKGDWNAISKELFQNSFLANEAAFMSLLESEPADLVMKAKMDPLVQLVDDIQKTAEEKINPQYNALIGEINTLKRTYITAQREVFKERRFYPDANSTMRMSYGKVEGYKPRDGVYFEPFTTAEGIIAKYVPGDYEFNLDERFRDLVAKKDYGKYAVNGELPVNFIGSIHTTGGNSGSPVLNGDGHLVGLLFDGSWEGVMSDIYYNPDLVRSIMVDIRYVLWVMDKYAGAQNLIDELNIIETSTTPVKSDKKSARSKVSKTQ